MSRPGNNTRQKLIETMLRLIWAAGYGAVSVEDICREAGVRKGSFYYFFQAALAVASFESEWVLWREEMAGMFQGNAPVVERFGAFADAVLTEQREKYKELGYVCGCPFSTIGSELATQDASIGKRIGDIFAGYIKFFEHALADGVAAGELRKDMDVVAKAQEIDAYLLGVLLSARIRNSIELLERHFRPGLMRLLAAERVEVPRKPKTTATPASSRTRRQATSGGA
jgi:TetR/AcrR family transcriptional regulator, transcriptional repressor for nem operon